MTSPFDWNTGQPSVLVSDRAARGVKGGKSYAQQATEIVRRKEKRTGRNPGTVYGISDKADEAIHPRRGRR